MGAIKQIKVGDVTYDIKAKQDIDGNDITTTYVKKDGEKVLSTEDFTTELKNKLDGIANNANNYTHPSNSGNKHIPSGGSSGQILVWKADGEAQWGTDKDTTPAKATTEAAGLMSAADKAKLDGIAAQANNYVLPAASTSIGGVKQGTAVADILEPSSASAESIATSFNSLLSSLRAAGIIAE